MINSQTNLKVESILIMHKYFLFSVQSMLIFFSSIVCFRSEIPVYDFLNALCQRSLLIFMNMPVFTRALTFFQSCYTLSYFTEYFLFIFLIALIMLFWLRSLFFYFLNFFKHLNILQKYFLHLFYFLSDCIFLMTERALTIIIGYFYYDDYFLEGLFCTLLLSDQFKLNSWWSDTYSYLSKE